MLAPNAAADLNLEFVPGNNGSLPTFHFDGFVSGRVSCGLGAQSQRKTKSVASLTKSTSEVLKSFYNNGSDLTLKDISRTGHDRWQTVSSFKPDARLKLCNYTTTTQIIVGLSQLAFAVAGDTLERQQADLDWSRGDFLNSMSDQALVNLNYTRASVLHHELNLATDLVAVKNVRGCKFIRLKINGDLNGTMDNMLSPRVPVKSIRVNGARY